MLKNIFQKTACLFIVSMFLPSCSTNPATGKTVFTGLMPAAQEHQIGLAEHQKVIKSFGVIQDDKITSFTNNIIKRLEKHSERKDVTYRLTVLDSDVVNAFAIPGGFLYITRGLLAIANSEDEVAAVLAHEMGHITAQHSAQQYSQGTLLNLGSSLVGIVTGYGAAAQAASLGSDLYLKGYSREHEYEADLLGVRYLSYENYNPKAMALFLENLERHKNWESKGAQQTTTPEYLSTHPSTPKRVEQAIALAAQQNPALATDHSQASRQKYLTMINGINFGESDAQGVIRGQRFAHTVLDFTLRFPDNFEIINTNSQIIGQLKQQKSSTAQMQIAFDIDKSSQDIPLKTYLTQKWGKTIVWNDIQITTEHGREKIQATAQVNNNDVLLIGLKDGNTIYRFTTLSKGLPAPTVLTWASDITKSFRSLTPQEKELYKAQSISVFTATDNDSLEKRAKDLPAPYTNDVDLLRVLNALDKTAPLKKGVRYKTIR